MAARHIRSVQRKRKEITSKLGQLDYELLCVIATDTGHSDEPAKTSHRGMAERAGCHYNTVGPHLAKLQDAGYIEVSKKVKYESYRLLVDCEPNTYHENGTQNDCDNDCDRLSQLEERLSQLEQRLSQFSELLSQNGVKIVTSDSTAIVTKVSEVVKSEDTCEDAPELAQDVPHKQPKTTRKEADTAKSELERHFAIKTQLPVPQRKTKRQKSAAAVRWWNPLTEIWQLCGQDTEKAKRLIDAAIQKMDSSGLDYDAPQSILSVARSTYGQAQRRGTAVHAPNNNMNGSLGGLRGV